MRNEILKIIWKRSVDGKIDHSSYGDMADELAEMVAKNLHKPLVIKSVCDCVNLEPTTAGWRCKNCGKIFPYSY